MQAGSAPEGYYTHVWIRVTVDSGRNYIYEWDTPMALTTAAHKCVAWAKHEMKIEKRRRRTKITKIEVHAAYRLLQGR